jgi:hypothetical protein
MKAKTVLAGARNFSKKFHTGSGNLPAFYSIIFRAETAGTSTSLLIFI